MVFKKIVLKNNPPKKRNTAKHKFATKMKNSNIDRSTIGHMKADTGTCLNLPIRKLTVI